MHRFSIVFRFLIAGLALSALAAGAFSAQAAYPERPISVIVTYNAGGSNDTIARYIAPLLQKELGQPIVIVNRGGAGGTIGVNELLQKPADGYTIGFSCSATFAFDPQIRKVPYDMRAVEYLATIGIQQMNVNAPVDAPYNNLTELIDYARKNGKSLSFATPITTELYWLQYIGDKAGIKFRLVPTKSGGEAMTQVLGGHVDLAGTGGPEDPYVKAGKLKRLFNTFPGKMSGGADVQSPEEAGYPEVGAMAAYHYFAPPGLPRDIAAKLEAAVLKVSRNPEFEQFLRDNSFVPLRMTGEETKVMIDKQIDQYRFIIDYVEALKKKQ